MPILNSLTYAGGTDVTLKYVQGTASTYKGDLYVSGLDFEPIMVICTHARETSGSITYGWVAAYAWKVETGVLAYIASETGEFNTVAYLEPGSFTIQAASSYGFGGDYTYRAYYLE